MIAYYSGCGNSRWFAECLAKALNDRLLFIPDELDKVCEYDLLPEEKLGFVFPVYAWAPPQIVLDFVKKLKLKNHPSYVYMVCTCGDEAGFTESVFRKTLAKIGCQLNAAFCIVMPETYLGMAGFKLDTPEGERNKIENAKAQLPQVIEKISQKSDGFSNVIIGSTPYLKTYLVKPLFQAFVISDKPYRVQDNCISCGKCVTSCPVHNIELKDGKPMWKHQCVGCMSCYHHCPVNAIQYGKHTLGKGQYYFGRKGVF
jgi:Uncharacterized Fe-S center protein